MCEDEHTDLFTKMCLSQSALSPSSTQPIKMIIWPVCVFFVVILASFWSILVKCSVGLFQHSYKFHETLRNSLDWSIYACDCAHIWWYTHNNTTDLKLKSTPIFHFYFVDRLHISFVSLSVRCRLFVGLIIRSKGPAMDFVQLMWRASMVNLLKTDK